ncbi:MAG: glycoside hydrolase [Bacteroidia bacterium]|nr:glycoside hydrolase [Bacteroidia bacterium]
MKSLFLTFLFLFMGCAAISYKPFKYNGVSFVASRDSIANTDVEPLLKINANAAAVMPFGYIRQLDHPTIAFNTDRMWFGETIIGAEQCIDQLHLSNIRVMLKPQLWVRRGEFTGKIAMDSEEHWQELEQSYTAFILEFAKLAERKHVDLFCIGTELELFIKYRPQYWKNLIDQIKEVYKGKLTYAANWDEYWRTPFWDQLDYIGIDGYFPVSTMQTPTVDDCRKGWQKHKASMKSLSESKKRPIIFTEYGYRSVDYAGKKPWFVDYFAEGVNLEAQSNAYTALYVELWSENWFAGGFIWKWFVDGERHGGQDSNRFTPQNKPVEEIITSYYKAANLN